jgi:hypothetical protein
MLPRHLISHIIIDYIPNRQKQQTQHHHILVIKQIKILYHDFILSTSNDPFYIFWKLCIESKQSQYNGFLRTTNRYILNEYQQRCLIFKHLPYPTFFEKKYPMKFRQVLQQLQDYFYLHYHIFQDPLYTPTGYYTINGFEYNQKLCLETLKKILSPHT